MVTHYLNPPETLALVYLISYFMVHKESSIYDCTMFALQNLKFKKKKRKRLTQVSFLKIFAKIATI